MRTSRSRAVIDALMVKLAEVREIEGSKPTTIKHDFGNLADAQHANPPRIVWRFQGGVSRESVPVPHVEGEPAAIGYRRANYLARIWTPNDGNDLKGRAVGLERAEQMLDQLQTASRMLSDANAVVFEGQPYTVPTETEGKWLERGAVIDATIGIRTRVLGEPFDRDALVEVASTELRTGIENPIGEAESATAYEVNEWVNPDKYSEP